MGSGQRAKILLVDDDEGLLHLLKMRLSSVGYVVDTAPDGQTCLEKLDVFQPNVLISDLRMDNLDGLGLFERVNQRQAFLPVILISAHGTIPEAVEATQRGVFSFLQKPIQKDTLYDVIERALQQTGQVEGQKDSWNTTIMTQSTKMAEVVKKARLLSQSDSNLMLLGENGVGKGLFGKNIHKTSKRKNGPFMVFNCAAYSEEALERELFGAKEKAGMVSRGALHEAKGGTLLLEEVDKLPWHVQSRLAQILEERPISRFGSRKPFELDVRLISESATNLTPLVEEGSFRRDLLCLLATSCLKIPSLSERREDISLLAKHFLQLVAIRQRPRVKSFSPKSLELICNARWPGNVTQLYHLVEELVILATGSVISESLTRSILMPKVAPQQSLADAKAAFERDYLIQVLKQARGNVSRAARAAKRNRTDFYKLMARHNLQAAQFKV